MKPCVLRCSFFVGFGLSFRDSVFGFVSGFGFHQIPDGLACYAHVVQELSFMFRRKLCNCLEFHIVIVARWVANVLWPWSPRAPSSWTLGHVFAVVLATTTITWILLWLLLKHDGERLSALGLATKQLKSSLLPGARFGLGIFGVCNFIVPFLTQKWLSDSHALPTANWFRSLAAIPIWMFLGWIAGGLTEEARRVFVLTRFERTCGRAGLVSAMVISSGTFGLGHLYQGQSAAFSLGVSGALYALVYLRRRSCWEAVIAHATFDTIGVAVLFYLNLGQGG